MISQRTSPLKSQLELLHMHQQNGTSSKSMNRASTITTTMDYCIPEEPIGLPHVHIDPPAVANGKKEAEKVEQIVDSMAKLKTTTPILGIDFTQMGKRPRRASTHLVSLGNVLKDHDFLSDSSATNFVTGECCGGGCCMLAVGEMGSAASSGTSTPTPPVPTPQNPAFRSLRLNLQPLKSRAKLVGTTPMPVQDRFIYPLEEKEEVYESTCAVHSPAFVKPHPPYNVFSARLHAARQLTKEGAEKPTYHFDLDVTDYPEELEGVDFRVGGAIGVVAPNYEETVEIGRAHV